MNNLLTEKIKEEFYITLCFNISKGFENAGLKRAYLDFNRTLRIKDGGHKLRKSNQIKTQDYLGNELKKLISLQIRSQDEFDEKHKTLCHSLIAEWKELTVGQAQKWINMSLKYWFLFGEERIENIDKNAQFFHIPIDSYVQRGMFSENSPIAWSKINEYEVYFNFQLKHREKKTGNPPLLDEFNFFNNFKK